MFMKYLWLALFTVSPNKTPVFVELRRMNDLTSDDLITYVYKSIIGTSSSFSEQMFADAAKKGTLVFILDGFDEIAKEKKNTIERQILQFGENYPQTTIIVSGRPDPRFHSWQSFSTFQVLPMDKEQVLDLISKFSYEKTTKINFAKRVKKDLYGKHVTFLSNPLLATMMMLTFDQFADIPEKIFVFYEQAFDTLFSKHDATKEGFKRQHRTELSIDIFRQVLSYFCLFSYFAERFAFTHQELVRNVENAIKVARADVRADNFIADLQDAVCLIHEESLLFVFIHRSFQEYFAAYCLNANVGAKFFQIVDRVYARPNDIVVRMIFEMNPTKTEKLFIVPKIREVLFEAQDKGVTSSFVETARHLHLEGVIYAERHSKNELSIDETIRSVGGNDIQQFVNLIRKLYPPSFNQTGAELAVCVEKDQKVIR